MTISEIINLSQGLATLNLGYLGISVTIIALLGGSFYLFNVKPLKDTLSKQEDALNSLKNEVKSSFVRAEESLKSSVDVFRESYSEELAVILRQQEEKIISNSQSQMAILDKELSEKIDAVAKEKDDNLKVVLLSEIGNQIRSLEKTLSTTLDEYKVSNSIEVRSLEKKIDSGLRELNITVKELEAFKYHSEGKMGGILSLMEVLEERIEYKPHLLSFILEEMKARISQYSLHKEDADRLKDLLAKIKQKEHKEIIAVIEKSIVLRGKKK